MDLAGRVYVVTGANSGIGKEITSFLARKGGKVYMICRNEGRAEKAKTEVEEAVAAAQSAGSVSTVIADCSLKGSVAAAAATIAAAEPNGVDALVCNAGVLLNERTLTSEGVETTFACHLLFGTYYLTKQLEAPLRAAAAAGRAPRVVLVSSGGMYNTRFPRWETAASLPNDAPPDYDGNMAYAYAKRGQVLLAEQWARDEAAKGGPLKFVSAHPGWVSTPAVDAAYGDQKKYLEPMRTQWQGAEGICWLATAPAEELESGAFYLDRSPQAKHMAGPFFSEGSYTKNTPAQVADMVKNLDAMCA